MAANRHRGLRAQILGLVLGCASIAATGPAQAGPAEPDEDPPPTWRFHAVDRPVKVVVLAGSIGAWQRRPYARRIEEMCANVEVRNLSKTGYGAWALKQRFKQQVLENARVNLSDSTYEYWLIFQGGLNSVATPHTTNRHMRDLYVMAHARGMKVVGLTLTPWGDDADRRWRGVNGLTYLGYTRTIVDFVMGRSTPQEALGRHAERRANARAPWAPEELPDIAVDLYDSALRDTEAKLRDVDSMREQLERDGAWRRGHAGDDDDERARILDEDAATVAELPRWYLREQLRSFDHIHPNEDGHQVIAETICPQLPEDWGCRCPDAARPDEEQAAPAVE